MQKTYRGTKPQKRLWSAIASPLKKISKLEPLIKKRKFLKPKTTPTLKLSSLCIKLSSIKLKNKKTCSPIKSPNMKKKEPSKFSLEESIINNKELI